MVVALPPVAATTGTGLWKISKADEESLDIYEGYPSLYTKKELDVICDGQIVRAMVYVMTHKLGWAKPSDAYLNTILQGYEDFGLDTDQLMGQVIGAAINQAIEEGEERRHGKGKN